MVDEKKNKGAGVGNRRFLQRKVSETWVPANKKEKKGQEEIFGFLLIVALIIVVGALFLLLQKPSQPKLENDQVSNLIYSVVAYTSSYQNKQIREVIEDCYNENEEACEIAEEEIEEMLDIALNESGMIIGHQLKGYSLNVSNSEELFIIEKGIVDGNMIGYPAIIHSTPQDLVATLRFFY